MRQLNLENVRFSRTCIALCNYHLLIEDDDCL